METDVLIIGAGAVGCAIARELSRYQLDVTVVDKNEDVGGDASKSNSAIIHTGYDAKPGTLESELVVAANPMYDQIVQELAVPFKRIGAILPAINDEQYAQLPELLHKSFMNRVYDVEYLTGDELRQMEPELNPTVKAGLYIPRESIIDPFLLVIGYAENAAQNGVKFMLDTKVTGMTLENGNIAAVKTTAGEIRARYVVNAAGLYCDEVAGMVGKGNYKVNPRKGQFFILDCTTGCQVKHIVLPIPTKITKGKLMCPTIHGNMLVGPTAEDLEDKEEKSTTAAGLDSIAADVTKLIPNVRLRDTITQYCGLRPNKTPEGVCVDTYEDVRNLVNISGVRSTGLTASASLGKLATNKLQEIGLELERNKSFNPIRKGIRLFRDMTLEEQSEAVRENPLYGRIICRCETVTEAEILQAIHSIIPARSVDAVKRRLRAGMGRCQGGFCAPRIISILARELQLSPEEITKKGGKSRMVTGFSIEE
mgnify:CR=1 FL=1|jgi:glycerol-3-phosphate dehydrogenase